MDVSVERVVTGEFDKLCDALAEGPENWMPGMFESAIGEISELVATTPLGRLDRYARLEVGAAVRGNAELIVPIAWHALDAEPLFPAFKGQLRLSQADNANRLALEGHYEPPGGIVGRAADAAAMHVIAVTTVEDFLERVAGVLTRNALGRSVAAQVGTGHLTLDE